MADKEKTPEGFDGPSAGKDGENKKTGNRGRGRGRRKFSRVNKNDESWYNYNPEFTESAGKLSFGEITATAIKFAETDHFGGSTPQTETRAYLPYLVRLTFAHAIDTYSSYPDISGFDASSASDYDKFGDELGPATVAARNVYSFVRHANSGHTNYEAPDLFMYLIAKGETYSIIFYLMRIYGILNTFDPRNRAYPDKLLDLMGLAYSDFILHIADLRYYILALTNRLNSLYTPQNFNYFLRASHRYAAIYKDCQDGKAATIVACPAFFWKWNPITTAGSPVLGSHLEAVAMPESGDGYTYANFIALIESIVGPLFADEEVGIMSGDIMKAYSSYHILSNMPEDLKCFPIYDENFLSQMENANFYNGDTVYNNLVTWDVYQSGAGVVTQPKLIYKPTSWNATTRSVANCLAPTSRIFNIHSESATPTQIIEWSALCSLAQTDDNLDLCVTHSGSEVLIQVQVAGAAILNASGNITHNIIQNINPAVLFTMATFSSTPTTTEVSTKLSQFAVIMQAAQIDHMPLMRLNGVPGTFGASITSSVTASVLGDIDNYTTYTDFELNKWHNVRWLSLFCVPNSK